MITTEQFEHKLIEYLDGELSDAEKREVEEYLQAHPEAIDLKGDFSLLCAAGKSIRESNFPADLLLEANRKLAARLADSRPEDATSTPVASSNGSPETAPSRTWLPNWRRRLRPPVLAAVLAALAILLVGVVTQRAALADIANSLLQRIVVTFNDEPLSDSQQQAFGELVEITETVDENGDQVVTLNVPTDQILQELGDGALKV
ncbi:MAG: zf-HC2 domain-containing protein, partial [Gemmatimonadetes bacterium]|nr:zf-HC2 domain-containing protein [Gemmatimonadota bacterium]